MRRWIAYFLVMLVSTSLACDGGNSQPSEATEPEAEGWDPPQAPNTVRLVTGEFTVPPGEELLICETFPAFEKDTWVHSLAGFQRKGAHHLVLYTATTGTRPEGSYICDDEDMTSTELVGTAATAFVPDKALEPQGMDLPDGFARKIEAGRQLIVQSHYINVTSEELRWHDVLDIGVLDESEVETRLGQFIGSTANIKIPPNDGASVEIPCTFEEETNFFSFGGHTHKLGTLFSLTHIREGVEQEIYRETNGALLETDAPSVDSFPDGSPLKMLAGDQLIIRCEWDNPTDEEVAFPREMCALVSQYWPDRGELLCATAAMAEDCGGRACTADEVCCINPLGQGECSTRETCDSTWSCEDDSECNAGDLCCEVPVVGQACLSENTCPGRTPCPSDGSACEQFTEFLPMSCCEATGFCELDSNCQM